MNFDFSDEQKFLKGEARKFLEARCPMVVTRGVLDDADRPFDRALWQTLAGMGWIGTTIPEKWGGAGLGHVELCAIAEELAPSLRRFPSHRRSMSSRKRSSGPEAAIVKIVAAPQMQDIATDALDSLDRYGIVATQIGGFQHNFFWGAAMRIAGGTDDILKNIIAERVLGLPPDLRVDRDVAFRDIPGGT